MPCSCVMAHLLLEQGKAKVVRRHPLRSNCFLSQTPYTQPLTLGVDTGSSVMGSAVAGENGNILYLSEVEIQNDKPGRSRATGVSPESSQPKNKIPSCTMAESKKLHQEGTIFTYHDGQNRRSSARNPLCPVVISYHIHGA